MIFRDTIAAIATPPGIGGIGIIRISGPEAGTIARRLFRPGRPTAELKSHRLYHGEIVNAETGVVLDEVLLSFLKAPCSYTGEDTVEISCHGGPLVLRTVLEEVLRTGARPADRGEFTRRAYLNGRLDLSQAEAVLDIITSQTQPGLRLRSVACGETSPGESRRSAAGSSISSPESRPPSTSPRMTASAKSPTTPLPGSTKSFPKLQRLPRHTVTEKSTGKGSASSSPDVRMSENPR